MTDLDKAIELDPDDAGAYNNRGFNYAEMEQFEKAIADYNQALKLRSNYEHVDYLYNNRGFAYGRLGQYNLAFADFERVEALNPDNAWLYYYRAMIYLKMGENDKARSELELSLQFDDPPLDQKRKARAEALLR
jgi:Flp pilus assembly protein TadD